MTLRGNKNIEHKTVDRLVTGPAVEPVSVAEVKLHARVVDTDQDAYIEDAIVAAREEIETMTGLAFITQTWTLTMDNWPKHSNPWWDGPRYGAMTDIFGADHLSLFTPGRFPLQSVDSLIVRSYDGLETTLVPSDYFNIDLKSWPGRLGLKHGAVWPIAYQSINAIEFTYKAGFGSVATAVPEWAKRAIRTMAAYLYDNRSTGCSVGDAYSDSGAKKIVFRFSPARI